MGNCFSPKSSDLRNDSFNRETCFADSPWTIRHDNDTREDFGDSPWNSIDSSNTLGSRCSSSADSFCHWSQ